MMILFFSLSPETEVFGTAPFSFLSSFPRRIVFFSPQSILLSLLVFFMVSFAISFFFKDANLMAVFSFEHCVPGLPRVRAQAPFMNLLPTVLHSSSFFGPFR